MNNQTVNDDEKVSPDEDSSNRDADMSPKKDLPDENKASSDKDAAPEKNASETDKHQEQQEHKWMNTESLMKDDIEVYAHVYAELNNLKGTCETLKEKGLGGDAVKEAIGVIDELIEKIHVIEDTRGESETSSNNGSADEEDLY